MAHIYSTATLTPSKLELLQAWLPGQPWFSEYAAADVRQLAAYRFDDPAGEVGMEGHLLQAGDGAVLHAPLTYRGAPLDGGQDHLVGTTHHSVLGERWVYNACGDPVWAAALATVVLTGGTQADELVDAGGERQYRRPSATVRGSGKPGTRVDHIDAVSVRDVGQTTLIDTGALELIVVRVVGADVVAPWTLSAQWGQTGSGVLAGVANRLDPDRSR
jgi:hypothetical protein